jgi:hypothetical protein
MSTRPNQTLLLCALVVAACDYDAERDGAMRDDHQQTTDPESAAADDTTDDTTRTPSDVTKPATEGGPTAIDPGPAHSDDLPVWKDSSARIQIATRNYWLGSMVFESDVAELSAQQLHLLRSLRRTKADKDVCAYDAMEATTTIIDSDGSSETFELENGVCHYDGPLLASAPVTALLRTLDCVTVGQFGWSQGGERFPAEVFPIVKANDGCTHGLTGSPMWVLLDVTDTNAMYTLEGRDCFFRDLHIQLYDEARKTLLASGMENAATGCPSVQYRFATPGQYAIQLTGSGLYSLRVSAE